jgi:hypothetical protein
MKIIYQPAIGDTKPNFIVQSNYSEETEMWGFIFNPLRVGPFDVALFKIKWK